jgi:hypothetical protein
VARARCLDLPSRVFGSLVSSPGVTAGSHPLVDSPVARGSSPLDVSRLSVRDPRYAVGHFLGLAVFHRWTSAVASQLSASTRLDFDGTSRVFRQLDLASTADVPGQVRSGRPHRGPSHGLSRPFSTCQRPGSTRRELAALATFRLQGLVTLLTVFSPRRLAGFFSPRQRSWDSSPSKRSPLARLPTGFPDRCTRMPLADRDLPPDESDGPERPAPTSRL